MLGTVDGSGQITSDKGMRANVQRCHSHVQETAYRDKPELFSFCLTAWDKSWIAGEYSVGRRGDESDSGWRADPTMG